MEGKLYKLTGLIAPFILLLACTDSEAGQNAAIGSVPEIKKNCGTCHIDIAKGPDLKKALSQLCLDCHPDRIAPNDHKVDIIPPMKVGKLPLSEGKLTCATCHDPHSNPYGNLLRMRERDLCTQCHPY